MGLSGDTMNLSADMTVRELIARHPEAIQFFLRRNMLCVGCPTEEFHTLAEVARIHGEVTDHFIEELVRSIGSD